MANDNAPIAVDFVVINDPELLKTLLTLSSAQWFTQRDQFIRDYPQALNVWGHELVPGQKLTFQKVPIGGLAAVGLLVFAGYNSPGVHRLRLDQSHDVLIRLDNKDLQAITTNRPTGF
ncbi:type VI secretion system protein [Silvimonas terrae]|uniref:Type VI secretion system protein n=1 Tax=Silvimonas terrae TaxID=300266 RepID=A0A840RDQ4_9NEIS|nr:hypothetical protein [Silvimonas terrae]MBB5190658.1 type VI secretion system protein [Silvimonas terrae]